MSTRSRWMWAAGGGLALAALAWAFAPRPVAVEAVRVTQGHFERTVDEDGKTRVVDRFTVSAPLSGELERVALREGDVVAEGAALALLTPAPAPMLDARALLEQRTRVEAARAQVDLAATRVRSARVALEKAVDDARRSEQLSSQGFVSATKLQTDQLARRDAAMELEAARLARHVADHDLQTAQAALSTVNSIHAGAGQTDDRFVVRAPARGEVLRVLQPNQAVVSIGTPLLELGDTSHMEVVSDVLTTDAVQIAPGALVRISRWGGPGVLEGRVRRIEPAAFTKVSALGVEEQRVRVIMDLLTAHERWKALGDGFRVSCGIVVQTADNAVLVPVGAVFPRPGASEAQSMAVFVVDGGRARLVPVTVGGRNAQQAWITQGLRAGQTVIVYPPASVRDGVRVKPRQV